MAHLLFAIEFCSVIVVFFWILALIVQGEAWPLPAPKEGEEGGRILLGVVLMLCYLAIFGVI